MIQREHLSLEDGDRVAPPAGGKCAGAHRSFCIAGLPIHDVSMDDAITLIHRAAAERLGLFLSTPNLNFLVTALRNPAFRETVLASDLCIPDGQPLIWIARLLRIPIHRRVAGSDLLATLIRDETRGDHERPLRLLFFGGQENTGQRAADRINSSAGGLECVGAINPGFGTVESMSTEAIFDAINMPEADMLVAALGAEKGQLWLHRNRDRIDAPVVAHLGAAMNFIAGDVRRAPLWMRRMQIEWIWRTIQEPRLIRRYGADGLYFLGILAARILPYAIWLRLRPPGPVPVMTKADESGSGVAAYDLQGWFEAEGVKLFRHAVAADLAHNVDIQLNFAEVDGFGPEFAAALSHVAQQLKNKGRRLRIHDCSRRIRRLFGWNFCDDLLE